MAARPTPSAPLRQLVWTLYFCLFSATALYWLVPYYVSLGEVEVEAGFVKPLFLAVGLATAAAALYVRFSLIASLLESKAPLEPPGLEPRLRTYYIVCYSLCESVGLFGLVLYLLGGARQDFALLYLAALGLFLVCYPRLPQSLPPGP